MVIAKPFITGIIAKNRRMKLRNLLVIAFTGMIALSACGGSSVDFKFNVPKGTKFNYNVVMDMNIDQNVMGQSVKVDSKITMGYVFEVIDDSAGWKKMTSTVSKFGMVMNANGMNMNFDSDVPVSDTATGPMAKVGKIFGALKGGQFTFTMNEKGEVGQVMGMHDMINKIVANMPATDSAMGAATLGQSFSEESFKQNIQQSFAMYPGKPVKVGDSWTKTLQMNNNGMPMTLNNTYTMQGVEGDKINVKVDSKITSNGGGPMPGMQVDMTGELKGVNSFDKTTGMPVSGADNMKVDMKMKMQGQEIPMKMDMKMTISGQKI